MESKLIYQNLIEAIRLKISGDKESVKTLSRELQLGEDVIYKRLAGDELFSFSELVVISEKLNISLDHIVNSFNTKKKVARFQFDNPYDPTSHHYIVLDGVVNLLKSAKGKKNTEGGEATNTIPQPLYLKYENISRYFLFKWKCQFDNEVTPYHEVVIPHKLRKLQLANVKAVQYLLTTDYIFDNLLFYYVVSEIKLFNSNNLISDKDCQLIKADLFRILEDMIILSKSGFYKDSGNALNIYISNTNLSASYCYIQTPELQLSLIKAFSLNGVTSVDREVFEMLKSRIYSLKRHSTLISASGETERLQFIDNQYKMIEEI